MFNTVASHFISIFLFLSLLGFLFSYAWITFVSKTEIVESKENHLKILLALYVHAVYFIFVCLQIFSELSKKNALQPSLFMFLLLITSIFPTLYLIYNYLNLNRHFIKRFGLKRAHRFSNSEEETTKRYISNATESLGLKKMPTLLYSGTDNISPFVFGKGFKKSFLSLPKNFDEVLENVTNGNPQLKASLKQFIILHEMSHVKHRDHIFMGSSYFFLKSFKYWLIVALLLTLTYLLSPFDSISIDYSRLFNPILFGAIYYFLYYLLVISVSKKRELLADANAFLFMHKKDIESILTNSANFKSKKMSYLESILNWFSIFSRLETGILGLSESKSNLVRCTSATKISTLKRTVIIPLSTFIQKIFSAHPKRDLRIICFKSQLLLKKDHSFVSIQTAIWTGIVLALLNAIPNFLGADFKTLSRFPITGDIALGHMFLPFIVLLNVIIFSVPIFKKKSVVTPSSPKGYFKPIAYRYLVSYLLFCVASIVLGAISNFPAFKPTFGFLFISGFSGGSVLRITLMLALGFFTGLILSLFAFRFHFNYSRIFGDIRNITQKTIVTNTIIIYIFVIMFMFLLNSVGINFQSLAIGFICGTLTYFFFGRKLPHYIDFDSMYEVFAINRMIIYKADKKINWGFSDIVPLFSFCLPLLFVSFLVNQIGNRLILVLITVVGTTITLSLLIRNAIRKTKKYFTFSPNPTAFLQSIHRYLHILKIIGRNSFKNGVLLDKIRSLRLDDYSFRFHPKIILGSSSATYNALFSQLYLDSDKPMKMSAKWFMNLENENGGFIPIDGLKPRLSSTFEALSVLAKFGMIREINLTNHLRWLKSLQTEEGYFVDSTSRQSKVEQTYYALCSLYYLENLNAINKESCGKWVWKSWQEYKKSIEAAFYSLMCMKYLDVSEETIENEIASHWLLSMSHTLKNLKIEGNLSQFYHYFKIVQLSTKKAAPKIGALIPDFENRVNSSFVSFLRKRGIKGGSVES